MTKGAATMRKTKEQCIAEIMKCVDKMTLEQREKFLAYLRTLHEKEEAGGSTGQDY